jgi:HK97 gp10 family phage protein
MADQVIQLTGLDGVLNMLKQMPAEVVAKRGGPVRKALRKGAVVILKQAKTNLQASTSNETVDGRESTGLLLKNLIVSRGKPPAGENGERYLIRVKSKTYGRKGKKFTTQQAGRNLEYGTVKQPAEPWLRPAFNAKAQEAIKTVETELVKDIDRIAQKMLKQGGA